jgi:hypothetical protein
MATRKPKAPAEQAAADIIKPARKPRAKKEVDPNTLTKEDATKKKLPWVKVLQLHVDPNGPRNGFFELDWNEFFILQLKEAGYQGNSEEEVVDGWFKLLCAGIADEGGIDMERRGAGYINVNSIGNGRSEIS